MPLPQVTHAFRVLRKDPIFTASHLFTSSWHWRDAVDVQLRGRHVAAAVAGARPKPCAGHQYCRVRAVRPEPSHFLSRLS